MGLSSTPRKALVLTSLLFVVSAEAAKSKEYENIALPATARIAPTVSRSYLSPRVQLTGSNLRLKEPSVNHQQYVFAKEAFLAEKRDEAIKLLRQELDSGFKQNRDNMLLRLGQLYSEKYMELSYRENELYSQRLTEFEKVKATDKKAKQPAMDNGRSRAYLKQALDLFVNLEKEYPKHPKIDEVVFFIGFVEMEYGNGTKGEKYLDRVTREFPRSRKFDEALVYLGDYYFEKHKFRDALLKYKILANRKGASLHHYALYKIAWCELNTNELGKALKDMRELVETLEGNKEPAKFSLREQALRDLVVFYGEAGMVDEAMAYFTKTQGKEKAIENLKLIAEILKSKGRDEAAVKAYARLIEEYPDSLETPKLYLGMYDSLARLGRNDQAVKTLTEALQRFNPESSWAKSSPSEKAKEVRATMDNLSTEAEKAAFFYHQTAQKAQNKGSYNNALVLYTAILKNFPNFPERKKIHYFRAEILFADGKWLDAANSYMEAAQIPPKDKVADESAYNALLAIDRLTAKNDKIERYTKDEQKKIDTEPKEIPADEKRFIEVGEFYIREYPQGQRIVDVRFRIAAIYYRYHHFDRSLELFKDIALKHPKHRGATTAANIALDILNIKKDFESLDKLAGVFASTAGLGDAEFKAEMAAISGQIGFKKIESLEQQSKWKEAGDKYFAYYKANTASPLAEKALYNAFVCYEKANDTGRAAEASRLFVAKYPKSEYTQRFTLSLAKLAEKQYDFDEAQKLYYEYYKKFPKDKEAQKALYNSAVFAELLERNDTALNLYEEYLRTRAVSADEKRSIQISQAKIYRKKGNWEKVTQTYRRLARDAKNLEDRLEYLAELGRQYEKGGRTTERAQIINEIRVLAEGAKGGKVGTAIQYVAESKFKGVAKQRENYEKLELKFPVEDFVYLLGRKQKSLAKLSTSYDSVVEVGVPDWGVAALYEKSEAFDNFARAFAAVKIPAKYKGEERVEVEKQLKVLEEKIVKPLQTKVVDFLKSCVNKSSEFFVANEYSAKCREKLVRISQKADPKAPNENLAFEPSGIVPQPSYWTTRWMGEGGRL